MASTELCVRRLKRELQALIKSPIDGVEALPLETNLREWHFVLKGQVGTPYEGGLYHGKLEFPKDYPLKPPAIRLLTPSGRFKEGSKLCFSFSDFHPESWNPMWSVSTILLGFQSFMLDAESTLGSVEASARQRRILAARTLEFNCRNTSFCELFPHYVEEWEEQKRRRAEGHENGNAVAALAEETVESRQGEPPSSSMMLLSVAISVVLLAVLLRLIS
mmetsp:Transcript_44593/g.100711  ORF Transcript_44593/g.100711 Transcript_44593/m.100711 type:complete len:219 (+) Transcript_44593:187-843(+)